MSPTDPYSMNTLSDPNVAGNFATPTTPSLQLPRADAPTTPLPPALSAPPGLDTLWHILRRRWPIILGVGLTAAVLAAVVAALLTPARYSTYAVLHLSSRNPRTGSIDSDEFTSFQRTQVATIKSFDVLNRLIVRPEIRELSEMQKHQGGELEWLQKDLVVDTLLGPEILRVTLTGDNPDDLEKILNALVTTFKERFDVEEGEKLNRQIERVRANMRDLDRDLKKDKQDTPLAQAPGLDLRTLESRQQDLLTQIASVRFGLGQQLSQIRTDEANKADCERKRGNPAELVTEADVLANLDQDFEIRPLREDLAKARRELQKLRELSTNPAAGSNTLITSIAALEKEIANLQTKNSDKIRKALQDKEAQKLNNAIAELDKQIALHKREVEALKSELRVAQDSEDTVRLQLYNQRAREERLKDSSMANETVMRRLTADLGDMVASKTAPSRVDVKERAQVPTARQYDRKLKFAGGGALTLFGLVVAGFCLYEFSERRIYSQHDLGRGLGMKVVGTLPYQRSRAQATDAEQFAMLESSDALRTVLLQAGRNDGIRVVMVTSAGTGEGKTSLACQLAASLGRAGRRTLLVDADLRNPAAHAQFGMALAPGFAEAMRGEIDPDEAIKPTKVANLFLLPAGQSDLVAIQALAQDEVQTLFYHFKENYEFVVIDVSPVLPVADALVIGQHADAVLFSVLRDVSTLPLVYEAQQRLAALGIRLLGAVVSGERARVYGGRPLAMTVRPPVVPPTATMLPQSPPVAQAVPTATVVAPEVPPPVSMPELTLLAPQTDVKHGEPEAQSKGEQ